MSSQVASEQTPSEGPSSRTRLLDAAEALLLEEGYASVTSRRVGARAGLKPQLVHYYFESMDELFLEVLRRRAEKDLTSFEEAVQRDGSLESLWRLNANRSSTTFTIEFTALANHRKAIRAEMAHYSERFRAAQLSALTRALESHGVSKERVDPLAALVIMTGVAQVLAMEESLGFSTGHAETLAYIEQTLRTFEADPDRGDS